MSSPLWYWHRLRAMSPAELGAHARRKLYQLSDRFRSAQRFSSVRELPGNRPFPPLPSRDLVPAEFRTALEHDVAAILEGRWIAFGWLELRVDDPPLWHKDYLAGVDMATGKPALKLHHRLEGAADIKLIWEPNRWYSLVRLAQGSYLLRDARPADACLKWLEHWVGVNAPYFGWNWTSALESGLRLIQFLWIDALLTAADADLPPDSHKGHGSRAHRLTRLRARVLPPHVWFTWRDRSFGSSANNHLIGELSGLIVALVRWPELERWAAPLPTLQRLWEAEVLKQFAPDGGNREQALNYHLFSFEFCWIARMALLAGGRAPCAAVEERLRAAAGYFAAVQVERRQWDYGDSDSAYVTPFFTDWQGAASEWHRWFAQPASSSAIRFWIGEPPKPIQAPSVLTKAKCWRVFPESGVAIAAVDDWFLRLDFSPLGYLATASHGHCDALHVSIWNRGEPIVIDPGTGCYHHNRPLRDYLASWDAHNGPHPVGLAFPERRGAFLWSPLHPVPVWRFAGEMGIQVELRVPDGMMRRTVTRVPEKDSWRVDDAFEPADNGTDREVEVFWQLPPAARMEPLEANQYAVHSGTTSVKVAVSRLWTKIAHATPELGRGGSQDNLRGACSPAFRLVERGPWLLLRAPAKSRDLSTIFQRR